MAGVHKARDAASVLRTTTDYKVRDAASVLRTLQFKRVRDAASVLREVFTSGGGGGGGNPTYINPGSVSESGSFAFKSAAFAAFSTGGVPSSYTWGLLDGTGYVIAGQGTANATLQVFANPGADVLSTFFCDMVIGGITYRATASYYYFRTGGGGGPVE